jgi:hypothetical protein
MDFHTFDDHVETDPDNTDLEHITNIHSHTHKYTQIHSNILKYTQIQVSQNGITPTAKISERSSLRSPQEHLGRPQCQTEDIHVNLLFILLVRPLPGYQEARPDLPHLPAKKTSHN